MFVVQIHKKLTRIGVIFFSYFFKIVIHIEPWVGDESNFDIVNKSFGVFK